MRKPWATEPVQLFNSNAQQVNAIRYSYHFLSRPGEAVEAGSALSQVAVDQGIRDLDPMLIGIGLHGYQDSFSHRGFTVRGHGGAPYAGHAPDWAFLTPESQRFALQMAKGTYDKLAQYMSSPGNAERVPVYGGSPYHAFTYRRRKPDRTWGEIEGTIDNLLRQSGHPIDDAFTRHRNEGIGRYGFPFYTEELRLRTERWRAKIRADFGQDVDHATAMRSHPWDGLFAESAQQVYRPVGR